MKKNFIELPLHATVTGTLYSVHAGRVHIVDRVSYTPIGIEIVVNFAYCLV